MTEISDSELRIWYGGWQLEVNAITSELELVHLPDGSVDPVATTPDNLRALERANAITDVLNSLSELAIRNGINPNEPIS